MRKLPTFKNAAVLAWARDEGPDTLATAALDEILLPLYARLGIPQGTLERMTGIKSRNLYPTDSPPSRGAIRAAQALFHKCGLKAKDIDLLYSTSVGRDFLEPSTASIIHSALGVSSEAISLDLGSACLGFIDGLALSALQVDLSLIDYALVVAGENAKVVLESTVKRLVQANITISTFFRHFATLTLGSGGAAMLVGRADRYPDAPRIKALASLTDPLSNELCRGDMDFMETDASKLLACGVELARATFERGKAAFGWSRKYFDLIISHQVSEVNTRRFAESLELPWDKVKKTYPDYGNMGPVAIPFSFDLAFDEGLIRPGMSVGLMGIGSGLACGMLEIEIPESFKGLTYF
jgi:3-oxoacyl-[acyl-carrier-protein] synthase-3